MSDNIKNRQIALAWRDAWSNRQFRVKFISGSIIFCAILLFFPTFFNMIEHRHGPLLNDWLLNALPSVDVSLPTFIIIWSMTAWLLSRCTQSPKLSLQFLCSIILLFSLRMIAIMLLPLDPPPGIIPLKDPVSSLVYGGTNVFITKDLFFSGHTSVQFLIFLSLNNKAEKRIALLATLSVAGLLLLQHVHYAIDVLCAIPVTYLVYLWGRKISEY